MTESTALASEIMTADADQERRGVAFWLLLGLALMVALYLVAWLATRYDGDEGAAPSTTTPTTTAPTTQSPTTAAPTTTPSTTVAPTTVAPTTTEAETTTSLAEPRTITELLSGGLFIAGPLEAAGLLDTLDGPGPFLVLAPTTEAFNRVGTDVLARLSADSEGLLRQTLLHHVVEGSFEQADLAEAGTTLTSLAGERLDFSSDTEGILVNDTVRVVGTELRAGNGTILVIDGVLVPQAVSTVLTADAISAIVELEPIQFDDGSATIRGESTATLDRAVEILIADPSARVEIGGHTDDIGPADGNQRLSVRRAEAVRDYLVGAGIAVERLVAVGYGQDEPIADNTTAEGRAINRRIEFTPLP